MSKRKVPYTMRGIKRIPCVCCGKPSSAQWQMCSLNNYFFGFCKECDTKLNALILDFMKVPFREEIMKIYADEMGVRDWPEKKFVPTQEQLSTGFFECQECHAVYYGTNITSPNLCPVCRAKGK